MTSQRTGALTAIAVIAIVLGLLGACGGVMGIGGLLVQGTLGDTQRRMLEASGAPPEHVEAQLAMQDQVNEIQQEWMPFTGTHQALNLIASSLLLAAGILLLRTSRTAPPLFVAAVAANVFVDIGGAVIGVLVQMDMQSVMQNMFSGAAMGDPQMDRMFDGIMKASGWTGVCFAAVWVALKLGYYLWGVIYLRKPEVRALFPSR
jgi:hypothetical protein